MNLSVKKISKILNAELIGTGKTYINEVIIDSRTFLHSDNILFFALKGKRHNGHDYINDLRRKGIKNFVVCNDYIPENINLKENFILVDDTLTALQNLSKYIRNNFNNRVISITGSNGKTIVKEWLFELLHKDINIVKSPKSYNSQVGVPLSVMLLDNKYDTAIIEAGISEKGEMQKLEEIIKPNTVIFTNIGTAHQENFKNIGEKITEKLILAQNAITLIYCKDNIEIHKKVQKLSHIKTFTWSKKNKADLYVSKITYNTKSCDITAFTGSREINFTLNFIDEASINNAITCLAYIVQSGFIKNFNLERFSELSSIEMRLEQKKAVNNCTLINDTYNSDINSLKIALDLLLAQKQYVNKTVILSDILQSGIGENEFCKSVNKLLQDANIQKFIGIGKVLKSGEKYFSKIKKSEFYFTTSEFLQTISVNNFKNEAILVKGARNFEFEKISEILQEKKYKTVFEINMNALVHNLNYYKSLIPSETKIMAMVKAFSYGNGGTEIANLLQHQNVDYLGVAIVDEGVRLRKAGITANIMVMNPESESFSQMIDYNLEPEIFDLQTLEIYSKTAQKYTAKIVPVHIKVDTGMKRLGFCDYQVSELIKALKSYNNIKVKSVFSHLAGTDEALHDDFTKFQISKFKEISKQISSSFDYPVMRHILNSSGIERFPDASFDMVRLGIGLYGFSPNNQDKLQNVSTLRSKISQIKNIAKNETVGYSRKGSMPDGGKIAVIPIGYADGLSRSLSNGKISFLINGKFVPVVGNICMDLCMVDVSNIEAKIGDEVIIFGDEFTANDVARLLKTISYEVITGISERVKRIYYQE